MSDRSFSPYLASVRAKEVVSRLEGGPVIGAEVGVHRGDMSAALMRLHPRLWLYMVDAWTEGVYTDDKDGLAGRTEAEALEDKAVASRQTEFAAGRRLILHGRSQDAAEDLRGDRVRLDFVFLDADHSREALERDIGAWVPLIRPGGLLGGHDYGDPRFAVTQVVGEAAEANGWTVELGENRTWFVRLP